MSTQEYIRSITSDFPTLTPLPEDTISNTSDSFFSNVDWKTWIVIILILALLGINLFSYLAKGTEDSASLFKKYGVPILGYFGYATLETTKQTVETSATGTKAGVDVVANTTTNTINTIEQVPMPKQSPMPGPGPRSQTGPIPKGQIAHSSFSKGETPVQDKIQQTGANIDAWQQDSLDKALSDASSNYKSSEPSPDSSRSSIQTTGKAGWCFIGEDHGLRKCSEIGINDKCMSGDVFPNQAICMNPNLRV
jgi:hypothetical protein